MVSFQVVRDGEEINSVRLRRIFDLYRPNVDYFALRATDPEAAFEMNEQQT